MPTSTTCSVCCCFVNCSRYAFTPLLLSVVLSSKTIQCSECCSEFRIRQCGPILNRGKNSIFSARGAKTAACGAGLVRWLHIIQPTLRPSGSAALHQPRRPWVFFSNRLPDRDWATCPL